ncbi:MAG TPA: glucose-1-phosphate adenylyltransferase [Candidatus Sulfotelmatobacter sp.]|nr:glucose-1-phosphate adenylyltransferase [Candidatus Sulfotelmatobacter sp.]
MPSATPPSQDPDRVLTIILGGGQGTRLFPLTRERAKPAVPLGGKYRLVDIPISNSINSGMRRIYLLTQFLSESLHRHVYGSFKFDHFTQGFVEMLVAEQTPTNTSWYQGTADAVRKNFVHFRTADFDYALILSGDQLYRMDFRELLARHLQSAADLTISTILANRDAAPSLGIMQVDRDRRIVRFVEKPKEPTLLDGLRLDAQACAQLGVPAEQDQFLASMGIYLFNRQALFRLLDNDFHDFSKHIIPQAIQSGSYRVDAFVFQGYWEDIGTIRSFFEANLDLTAELPQFNFFDMRAPIYTRPRFLPASKVNGAAIDHAVVSDGCVLNHCRIASSIVGLRYLIEAGADINRTLIMGADYFESAESVQKSLAEKRPRIGIGKRTRIDTAIVDKNARIGDDCVISPADKPASVDHPLYFIRDGIVIIPKDAVIPHGTVI